MASITMKPSFDLTLNSAEMRLIILALTGRIDFKHEGKDQVAAKELGDILFRARASQTAQYASSHQLKQENPSEDT